MELIKLSENTINSETVQTVSARELHKFLGSRRQFSDWIKAKLERLRLIENKDFVCFSQNCEIANGGYKTVLEYYLTLDTAKHIAMMENTDRGFEVRDYFIQCEKQLKESKSNLPSNYLEALKALVASEEEKLVLIEENKRQKPKVSYYDLVLSSEGLLSTIQIAKDYGFSAVKFNKLFNSLGIQYKTSGQWLLYAKYQDKGYTKSYTHLDSNGVSRLVTRWTQKGRLFLYNLLKDGGASILSARCKI